MELLRLFIAIELPTDLKEKVTYLQRQIAKGITGVKWVAQDNLHLTLKFLGDNPQESVPRIVKAMNDTVEAFTTFPLVLGGLGCFPNKSKPKVIWLGIKGHRILELQSRLEDKMEEQGFLRENRRYSPHLTLGRIRDNFHCEISWDEITKAQGELIGEWQVADVKLYQSTLKPQGPIYHTINTANLKPGTV